MAPAMEVLSVSTAQMTRGQWGTPEGGPRGAAELMASIRSHPKQSEGEAGGADFERLFPWWGEPDPQQDRAPGPQQGRRTALPMLVEEDGASPSPSAAAAAQGRIEGSSANARRGLGGFRDPSEAEVRRWPEPLTAPAPFHHLPQRTPSGSAPPFNHYPPLPHRPSTSFHGLPRASTGASVARPSRSDRGWAVCPLRRERRHERGRWPGHLRGQLDLQQHRRRRGHVSRRCRGGGCRLRPLRWSVSMRLCLLE